MHTSIAAIIFAAFVLGHLSARHGHYFGQPTRRTVTKIPTPLKVKRR